MEGDQTEQTPRPTFDVQQISGPEAETNVNRASIEAAVSLLAKQQQAEIEKLMEQQAREREELRALFKRQQEQLVEEVMSRLKSGSLEEKKIEPEAQSGSRLNLEGYLKWCNWSNLFPAVSSSLSHINKGAFLS